MSTNDGTVAWRPGITGAPRAPRAAGLPLLGNFLELSGDVLPSMLAHREALGPIYRIGAFGAEFTCLVGREASALVTHTAYDYLAAGAAYQGYNDAFHSRSFLLGLDGADHADLRRIERRAMSREALVRNLHEAVDLTGRHLARWRPGEPIDVVRELKSLVLAHVGITLTGRDASALLADIQILLNHIVAVTQLKIWPRFLLRMPRFTGARRRVHEDIQRIIDDHRRRPPSARGGADGDLIDDMLAATLRDGRAVPDEAIFAATIGAYMAGLDTAAIIATFILYGVLKHPHVRARVMPEIDALFEGPLTWERISAMTAYRGAVMEALRMWPIVGLLPRDAACDFEFAGHQVRKGESLFLGVTAPHFDPSIYAHPEVFDIDRFAPPRNEHKPPGAFAPFGLGAHKCLGANMGELQAMIVVATLLHRLDLELCPRDYEMKIVAKPLRRPEMGFRVRVVGPRRPAVAARGMREVAAHASTANDAM